MRYHSNIPNNSGLRLIPTTKMDMKTLRGEGEAEMKYVHYCVKHNN